MKNSIWIIAIIALTISACTSQKQATSYVNDDVYNSTSQPQKVQFASTPSTSQGTQVIIAPDRSKVQKPASSTFENDYNDYSYSSRIDRFNTQDTTVGYFDEAYSGSTSDVIQSSNDPNVSIYLGSGYGGYYNPSFSFGYGWGYPYSSWGWDYGWGWGYPYYYGGYGPWYGSYYNPWYYSCCYCYGYNEYYPPYYASNNYYGPRTSLHRSDGGAYSSNSRAASTSNNSAFKRIEQRNGTTSYSRSSSQSTTRNATPSGQTVRSTGRTTPVNQEKYRYTRPANDRQAGAQRTTTQKTTRTQAQARTQQPTPRYIKPENVNPAQRSGSAQSYSSPVYRQPKSSKEYLAPRSQNQGSARSTNQNTAVRSGSGTTNNGYRQPSTQGNSNRTYSAPTRSGSSGSASPRSNTNYSAPTRSGNATPSQPARSGNSGSYSTPSNSNSGGSYSAPSRSGGSGGSSPSGGSGSSSGGGRRR